MGQEEAEAVDIQYVLAEGQITDPMGAALSGVVVTARPVGKPDSEPLATATTDSLGDFVLAASKPNEGKVAVTFAKEMFAELTREIEVGGEDVPYIGLSLHGNLTVQGRVLDALTKAPVVGAEVSAASYEESWSGTSDEEGRFTLTGVSPGGGELTVQAEGYGRERKMVRSFVDVQELVLRVKPERVVHVKVVDDAQRPVQGVMVEAFDQPRDDLRTFVTDDKGLVTVNGIHFDAEILTLRMMHDGHVSDVEFSRVLHLPKDKTVSTHQESIDRAGTISGTIADAKTGRPIHGARVMTGDTYVDHSPRDWTNHRGKYTIEGVRPGAATVTVHVRGYATDLRAVTVEPGNKAATDFELSAAQTIEGIVKDENGDPVADVFVRTGTWRKRKTLGLQAITDEKGRFLIEDAPRDEFELTAMPQIGEAVTKSVHGSSREPVTFTLAVAPDRDAPGGQEGLNLGDVAPAIEVTMIDGTKMNTADFAGKVVLLDFWATWCAPCLDELPYLATVWKKYGSRDDFVMIGLSRDFDVETLQNFLRVNTGITWPNAVGDAGGVETAAEKFGVTWIPRVYLIDRKGKVVGKNLRGEKVVQEVEKLFDTKDPS